MIIDLPSGKYKLWIRHDRGEFWIPRPARDDGACRALAKVVTQVRLETVEMNGYGYPRASWRASARCSAGDVFRKKVGVRIAVTRLLKLVGLPRTERALVWKRVWNLR